jgi:hypothetical protein
MTVCAAAAVKVVLLVRVQLMVTVLGVGVSAEPLLVVMTGSKVTLKAVRFPPEVGAKLTTIAVWAPLVAAPLQPAAKVTVQVVAVVIEPTEVLAGAVIVAGGVPVNVALTGRALPAAKSLMPIASGVGPATVSQ